MSLPVTQRHPRLSVNILSVTPAGYTVSYELTMQTPDDGQTASATAHADVLAVTTHKDIGEVAGTFSIRLTARRDADHRTWAHKINPGDYVEIRLSSDWVQDPKQETLVMRGFVDATNLVIGETTDGSPETYCQIDGRDYGKYLLRAMWYPAPTGNGQGVAYGGHLTDFSVPYWLEQGMPAITDPETFIRTVMNVVLRGGTGNSGIMPLPKGAPYLNLLLDHKALSRYQIMNTFEAPYTGSVWNLISYYQNSPFFEMFVTDDVDQGGEGPSTGGVFALQNSDGTTKAIDDALQPRLVWRRSPYHNKERKVAAADASIVFPDPPPLSLIDDIERMQVGRTDEQAFSYWVALVTYGESNDEAYWNWYAGLQANGGAALIDYSLVERFGFAPLEAVCNMPPSGTQQASISTQTTLNVQLQAGLLPRAQELSRWLNDVYERNYLYESGSITTRGLPALRIGRHVTIQETGQQFYIESVDHSFTVDPLRFTTTIGVTRGEWPVSPYEEVSDSGASQGFDTLGRASTTGITPAVFLSPGGPPTTAPPVGACHWVPPVPAGSMVCEQAYGCQGGYEPADGHQGIDLGATFQPAYAVASGTVVAAQDNHVTGETGLGLGNWVAIQLDGNNGQCGGTVVYGHLSTGSLTVQVGQHVTQGQQIATTGDAGASSAPHLHFEYHPQGGTPTQNEYTQVRGTPTVDPAPYFGLSCSC